jgi:hypothetical protein
MMMQQQQQRQMQQSQMHQQGQMGMNYPNSMVNNQVARLLIQIKHNLLDGNPGQLSKSRKHDDESAERPNESAKSAANVSTKSRNEQLRVAQEQAAPPPLYKSLFTNHISAISIH